MFQGLPSDLGYDSTPLWWSLPVLAIAGVVTAFAIVRLPGGGGHVPADGLKTSPTHPVDLPGVILAGLATIGLGLVLGPEAPLIALGGGLGALSVSLLRREVPDEVGAVLAAAGMFAALSLIFAFPLIAAVLLIEAAGIGGARLPVILIPGLLAAAIGSLISTGMGSWTGLSSSAYALGPLSLPHFARPDFVDFAWTIPFGAAVAVVTFVVFRLAKATQGVVESHRFLLMPVVGLLVSGLAIAFSQTTDKGVNEVLFSGQEALPGLISGASTWSLSALALLICFKGLAWALTLGSFRGGPTFPAMFLGAAGGLMAAHLPGFDLTPAVGVGLAAGVAAVLRLPLSAIVLAVLLTSQTGGRGDAAHHRRRVGGVPHDDRPLGAEALHGRRRSHRRGGGSHDHADVAAASHRIAVTCSLEPSCKTICPASSDRDEGGMASPRYKGATIPEFRAKRGFGGCRSGSRSMG